MTTIYLIRHGDTDTGGRLAGRSEGYHVSGRGRAQAETLAAHLSAVPFEAFYTSPLERTTTTAEILAAPHRLVPVPIEEFLEIEYGLWTGKTLHELEDDPRWNRFNTFRSGTSVPGGELVLEVQARTVRGIEALRARHPDGTAAVVSHADPIRTIIAHYSGIPIDLALRLAIDTASYSVLALAEYGAELRRLNCRAGEP